MELKQAIFTRCSCRSYTDEPVSEEHLNAVLAAANAAPVGMGAYGTVHLTVIRSKEFIAALSAATAPMRYTLPSPRSVAVSIMFSMMVPVF